MTSTLTYSPSLWRLALLLAATTFAGATSSAFAQNSNVVCTVTLDRQTYNTGQMLEVSITVTAAEATAPLDLYFGVLLPDGGSILHFTSLSFTTRVGALAHLAQLQPIVRGVPLMSNTAMSFPGFFRYQWRGTEPIGRYLFFFAAAPPGGFSPQRAVSLSLAELTFNGSVPDDQHHCSQRGDVGTIRAHRRRAIRLIAIGDVFRCTSGGSGADFRWRAYRRRSISPGPSGESAFAALRRRISGVGQRRTAHGVSRTRLACANRRPARDRTCDLDPGFATVGE